MFILKKFIKLRRNHFYKVGYGWLGMLKNQQLIMKEKKTFHLQQNNTFQTYLRLKNGARAFLLGQPELELFNMLQISFLFQLSREPKKKIV